LAQAILAQGRFVGLSGTRARFARQSGEMKIWVALLPFAGAKLIPTPHGYRPQECVVEIPGGATFFESEGGLAIDHADGRREMIPVHPACHTDDVALKMAHRRDLASSATGNATVGQWMDNAGYTYASGYSKFSGSYNIPTDPDVGKEQILYYFIGLENTDGGPLTILQPVLGWVNGEWTLASWACCPSNISTTSRELSGLSAGQIVEGNIVRTGSSTWKIDSTVNGQTTTLQPTVGSYNYVWADVTLEIYSISGCDEYSSGTVHFTDMQLAGSGGEAVTPAWTQPGGSDCQGKVDILDPTRIDISHNGGAGPTPSPGPPPGCTDTDSADDCTYWQNKGYCISSSDYYAYMQAHCCHTCGFGDALV